MKKLIKFWALVLVLSTAEGRVIHIPEDWPDIQKGIEMASAGDTVLVAPGTYLITHPSKRINFEGKAILLTSEKGADSTVIDGWEEYGPIVTFESGEDTNSVLKGFTITNGRSDRGGAGILCINNSSPKICNNIITANILDYEAAEGLGAGICCDTASPVIVGNLISANYCQVAIDFYGIGGGIFLRNSSASILNNTISSNWATLGGGIACLSRSSVRIEGNQIEGNEARGGKWANSGAGIYCDSELAMYIANNTITSNYVYYAYYIYDGGGIYCRGDSIIITENTITNNSASKGGGIYTSSFSVEVSENNIYGNTHYGLYSSDTNGVVDADSNWWGDKTGPYHPTLNPGGLGDTVSNWVDFVPWLSKPAGFKDDPLPTVLPKGFELFQNWPNPFNAATTLNYTLPQVIGKRFKVKGGPNTSHLIPITLKVYNILGQEVKTLVDEVQAPGYYRVLWDGRDDRGKAVASGIYLCRLEVIGVKAESQKLKAERTRRMVLIR